MNRNIKIIGMVFILLSLFFAYLCFLFKHSPEAYEIVLLPFMNMPLSVLYVITGIGIFRKKNWARISSILLLLTFAIYAGIYMRFFLSFTILRLPNLQRNTKIFINTPPNNFMETGPFITIDVIRDIILPLTCILLIGVSFFVIYYLTRYKVKTQFQRTLQVNKGK